MADVAQWYYFQGKQRVGPVSPQDVQDLLTGGDLPPDAMIRQNDERAEWNPAYSFGVFDIPEGRRLSPSQALGNGSVFQPYPAPAAMSDLWAAGEQSRPWVRYWAKMFDMNYFQVVWLAFLTFFAPGQTTVSIMDFMWAALAGFFP
ncbi:MAG: GYF domain-containing protein, partial [Acidobacteriota bacterium]